MTAIFHPTASKSDSGASGGAGGRELAKRAKAALAAMTGQQEMKICKLQASVIDQAQSRTR